LADSEYQVMMLVLDDDSCLVEDWLSGLRDKTTRARIVRQIDKLARGNFGVHKSVGEGLMELKLDFGPGYRVYYALHARAVIVLLGGSDKGDQQKAIEFARLHWSGFKRTDDKDKHLKRWE
jgi:putative addiction module killer protein